MNTAARDRALLPAVKNVLGRTPISKLKVSKEKDGSWVVALHTSRPNIVRMESTDIIKGLKIRIGTDRELKLNVVPEARAVAKYVRCSPRKARLVIDAIKGKRVSDAIAMLRFIPNHAAELISNVLISAAANAQDGWGAGPTDLRIVNILADGGPSLKRVKPRAQGRAYRILKRSSHLTVILTDAPPAVAKPRRVETPKAKPAQSAAPAAPVAAPVVEEKTAPVTSEAIEEPTAPVENVAAETETGAPASEPIEGEGA